MKKFNEKWLEDFLIRSTWSTNAIEGNKLTENQTRSILTVGKLPVIEEFSSIRISDITEVTNGRDAFQAMLVALKKNHFLDEELIKILHREIAKNLIDTAGKYKIYDNYITGTEFETARADVVDQEMSELLHWYQTELSNSKNLVKLFADFHLKFEMIHPFADGNGRTGRLILNFQLMSSGNYPISFNEKEIYLEFLKESQAKNLDWRKAEASEKFVKYLNECLKKEEKRDAFFKLNDQEK